jgi:hypothetical protein
LGGSGEGRGYEADRPQPPHGGCYVLSARSARRAAVDRCGAAEVGRVRLGFCGRCNGFGGRPSRRRGGPSGGFPERETVSLAVGFGTEAGTSGARIERRRRRFNPFSNPTSKPQTRTRGPRVPTLRMGRIGDPPYLPCQRQRKPNQRPARSRRRCRARRRFSEVSRKTMRTRVARGWSRRLRRSRLRRRSGIRNALRARERGRGRDGRRGAGVRRGLRSGGSGEDRGSRVRGSDRAQPPHGGCYVLSTVSAGSRGGRRLGGPVAIEGWFGVG